MTINPLDNIVNKKDKFHMKIWCPNHSPPSYTGDELEWFRLEKNKTHKIMKHKSLYKKTYNVKIIGNIYDSQQTKK